MRYNAQITRNTPTAILFLVDRSGSMAEHISYGSTMLSKAEAVSRTINNSFNEILNHCKKSEGYLDYFYVGCIGYGGSKVESLLEYATEENEYLCTISSLVRSNVENVSYNREISMPNGDDVVVKVDMPRYIYPGAAGITPMYKAFDCAYKVIRKWIKDHGDVNCFPPIIFNITDGEASDATDKDLIRISEKIKSMKTGNGEVLLFNIHICNSSSESIVFPSSTDELPVNERYAELLYHMSSYIPENFKEYVQLVRNVDFERDMVKAMSYNSSVAVLLKMLKVGSISVNLIN